MITISKITEETVRGILSETASSIDLHEKLFGPEGVFAKLCATKEDRAEITKTPLYREGKALLALLRTADIRQFKTTMALNNREKRL